MKKLRKKRFGGPKFLQIKPAAVEKPRPLSDLFHESFHSGTCGCTRECACGRFYFDYANSWDWQEGELEKLMEDAKRYPGKVFPLDYSVATYTLNGEEYVIGCVCNEGIEFEKFILRHAHQLAKYLNMRAERLRQEAEMTEVGAHSP